MVKGSSPGTFMLVLEALIQHFPTQGRWQDAFEMEPDRAYLRFTP